MISFLISVAALIAGYFIYGKIIEKVFGVDKQRITPAISKQDGVDYVPIKPWRIYMIQFLNIAGLGPIFGAIMGAKFGTSSFLWIVFGCIFGGAVHDYIAGMISLRRDGASLPEIHGEFLGPIVKQGMRGFMIILMILVGVVFVVGPAGLLASLTPKSLDTTFWICVILIYYILATLLPIDKLIGQIYPIFGFCLLFMAVGIFASFFIYHPHIPEFWDGLQNIHPQANTNPIFPVMFVSIACGAVSGFHATQSPLMARCMTNEKLGRPIFFGAMISEGIVALIWAAAASYFFHENGMNENNPAIIVNDITKSWLGIFGAILAVLGVIAAPITSGDTAFRSARLIISDIFHYDQKPIYKRLVIAVPMFLVAFGVLMYSVLDKNGFNIIWRYFAWANQVLAAVTLWATTIYLLKEKKLFILTLLPALFMTMVCITYILIAPEGFSLNQTLSYIVGACITTFSFAAFLFYLMKYKKTVLS